MITGSHQGMPSGAISVKEKIATSMSSTVMIGTSAVIRAGTRGLDCGAARRSEVIRAAMPNDPFITLATAPAAAARNNSRRLTVPPAAQTQTLQASLRASRATTCNTTASASSEIGAV